MAVWRNPLDVEAVPATGDPPRVWELDLRVLVVWVVFRPTRLMPDHRGRRRIAEVAQQIPHDPHGIGKSESK